MNHSPLSSTLMPSVQTQGLNTNKSGSNAILGSVSMSNSGTNNLATSSSQIPPSIGPTGDNAIQNSGSILEANQGGSNSVGQNTPSLSISSSLMGLTTTTASSEAPSAGSGEDSQPSVTMANTKEKTPMCLINELARYNQVQHQYRLVDESGPAHKKTFTVVLNLDNEEFTASGPSIKKAQHKAAAIALQQTKLKHPAPKVSHKTLGPITPTVELNALAMKRGELAVYQTIDTPRPPYIPNFNFRGMYNQRYHYPKIPPTYCVALKVGNRQFFGEGRTPQAARHAAAEEALRILREIPLPDQKKNLDQARMKEEKNLANGSAAAAIKKEDNEDGEESDLKSPISLVHEIALKHALSVNFEVIRESGPPHMRNFVTRCAVGDLVTEGEGNGKKVSKKRAAEKMYEELKKLPIIPPATPKVKKKPIIKKKSRNLIKVRSFEPSVSIPVRRKPIATLYFGTFPQEQKADPQYGQGINPISRLIQIQQAKKEREPVYSVIAERGEPRQREFVMQCTLGELMTSGAGPNKKTAKRNAAEAMLQLMGYSRPPAQNSKPIKAGGNDETVYRPQENEKPRKVTFLDHDVTEKNENEGKLGRQLVPGLLLMPDANLTGGQGLNRAPGGPVQSQDIVNKMMQTTSAIAKELLDNGVSPTAEAIRRSGHKPVTTPQTTVRPKQQLLYLADILGFHVHFTDFPKGNKMDYLSLVSLSTNPPQVSHGAGPTIEASHDQAALTALRALVELGLDSVTDTEKKELASGGLSNGLHMASGPKLANSATTADLGGNLKTGAPVPVTSKDGH